MTPRPDSPNAAEWCGERLPGPTEDLYLATLFTPLLVRSAVRAIAALYVEFESIAREFRDLNVARTKLAWWRGELGRLDAGAASHPATRLLAAAGPTPPAIALLDLLGGFELILLEGPPGDLATAEFRAERGCGRLAAVFTALSGRAPADALARAVGEAVGLARVLAMEPLQHEARQRIAAAARSRLAGDARGIGALPPPLPVLAALAWQRSAAPAAAPRRHRRVLTAWRAARGKFARSLRRDGEVGPKA